jgi:hypothetical protein
VRTTMSDVIGYFEDEQATLAATRAARAEGFAITDVFTPYAVHGLDEAMGLRPSRLPWVCFGAGLVGGAIGLGFQIWSSSVSWPLNVGGKPFVSLPAFIPITFELTVLAAALTTALALLVRARLFPGKRAAALPRVTDDRFALVLSAAGERGRAFLARAGAVEIAAEGGGS